MTGELNPFVYDDPLPPAELVDRAPEAEQLLRLAEGGHNTRLQAPRRYGKTTLLGKVAEDASKIGMNTVYVDFFRAITLPEVSRRIEEAYLSALAGPARRAVAAVARRWTGKVVVTPGGVGAEMEPVQLRKQQRLADLLDLPKKVFERSGVRTLVVFDEFQDLLRISSDVDGLLRSKIQFHRDEASYIFAGSEPGMLNALFADRQRLLFDQARPIPLDPLKDEDLIEYIGERFERAERDPREALDALVDLARGHPQRAMLLAHHLWEQTPRGEPATPERWQQALEAVYSEHGEALQATWDSMETKEQAVLAALAVGAESLFSARTLSRFNLSKGGAQHARDALVRSGHLHK